jgi:hypothetical protein
MKTNQLPEDSMTHDGASHGHAAQELLPEHEPAPAARRWELRPEMFQGQTLGWKVVRLI